MQLSARVGSNCICFVEVGIYRHISSNMLLSISIYFDKFSLYEALGHAL